MKSKEKHQAAEAKKPAITSLQIFAITLCVLLLSVFIYKYVSPNKASAPTSSVPDSVASNVPGPPAVYFIPRSQTYDNGMTFTVEVRENSGSTPVNAIQANFSYPADKLTYIKTDGSASPFTIPAESHASDGNVTLARGIIGSLSGDHSVARVTFKAKSAGSAKLTFTTGSALVSSATNHNLITDNSGLLEATYTIR